MQKRIYLVVLLISLIVAALFIGASIILEKEKITGRSIITKLLTGKASSRAFNVSVFVSPPLPTITIVAPENTTYGYAGIQDYYVLELNTTSNFEADAWWYNLVDLTNNLTLNSSIFFSQNTSINAVRRSNKLEVYANDTAGNVYNTNVTFYIYVPNSPPFIEHIDDRIFFCENEVASYYFNATDVDEDVLTSDISPKNPFFTYPATLSGGINVSVEILSLTELNKTHAGGINIGYRLYQETVSIDDNYNETCCVDSEQTNITVIEINNAPQITYIGTNQTVWTRGVNSIFYHETEVLDAEDGNQSSGNFKFNISFSSAALFNISTTGIMNFTPSSSQVGVYNVTICVNDTGIDNPHENISLCNQTGGSLTDCQTFSLTVTSQNRAPSIISYYPTNLTFQKLGTDAIYFNITKYDPDGTIPDAYWYADDVLNETDSGNSSDTFYHSFGCGVSGLHNVSVFVTDDIVSGLNDSLQWNISVANVACGGEEGGGGGGGGGGVVRCSPKLVYEDWNTCKSLENNRKELTLEEYNDIKVVCSENNWSTEICGFQSRDYYDKNNCNTTIRPEEIQACHFTEFPDCQDGIKNCHHGACEILVDCGGPCPICPTCSDKIKNHGETEVDCGGPCNPCAMEKPLPNFPKINYIFIAVLTLLLAFIIVQVFRIIAIKKQIKKIKLYHVFIVIVIAAAIFFFLYPRFDVGDFVYKKDALLIGEVKDASFTKYLVQWQDGSYTTESPLSIGLVSDLNEVKIQEVLRKNNSLGISFYSWDKEGKMFSSEVKDETTKDAPRVAVMTLSEVKNYSIRIGREGCIPKLACGMWGDCRAAYNLGGVVNENVSGKSYRYCKDIADCVAGFVQTRSCETRQEITIKKIVEQDKDYVEVYDKQDKLIFRLAREKLEQAKKLYIDIFLG